MKRILLTAIFTLTLCGAVLSEETKSKNSWIRQLTTTDAMIALAVPIAGAIVWVARDYIEKKQELGRRLFKDEIISSLNQTMKDLEVQRKEEVGERLRPLQDAVHALIAELKEGKLEDKELRKELRRLTEELSKISTRVYIQETRLDNFMENINAEVASILTEYLKDSVKVSLFQPADKEKKS